MGRPLAHSSLGLEKEGFLIQIALSFLTLSYECSKLFITLLLIKRNLYVTFLWT